MTRDELLQFLRAQPWAVEASVSGRGEPQAAVIGVAVTDRLELVFDTLATSRKAANLRANPRIALVLGWDDGQTVQIEGVADEPVGAEVEAAKETYLRRFPDGHERAAAKHPPRRARGRPAHGAPEPAQEVALAWLSGDIRDDLLRMLFVCCDDAIPIESQLVLALKTLCGFDVREIAERLFLTEANVYKRLARARARLRDAPLLDAELTPAQLAARLTAVHAVLYTLFTEGYLSSHADGALRRELCDDALRLATILTEHPVGTTPETHALLALMHLHRARVPARQDGSGGLLLLEEQDRSQWDTVEIQAGLSWLARAAEGEVFSRYHAEAGIAAEHCLAPSFAETRWDRIIACYELLEQLGPSALHTLNRAVAVAEQRGPEHGLIVLDGLSPPSWLSCSYQWSAVLSDLHRRAGHEELAGRYRETALGSAPSVPIREVLARRLR